MKKNRQQDSSSKPYDLGSNHLRIRGSKGKSCFLGVLFLLILTFFVFWLYAYLGEDQDPDIKNQDISNLTQAEEENIINTSKELPRIKVEKNGAKDKYEFRGAWLASVNNLDYPKEQNLSTDQLKEAFLKILDVYELYKLNAVIMQVRPEGDALYLSQLNPPSSFVTGDYTSALPFDLLEFAINETHKRGLEFHAWFNPFRVTSKALTSETGEILDQLAPQNFARKNPQLVLRFKDKLFLNPGEPKVREFVHQTIMEVVRNYDIDAVHLDDYFYPYASTQINDEGQVVPLYFGDNEEDLKSFEKDPRGITDIKAWRRDNTYLFIKDLSAELHDTKPYVQLGISPFGIWGHSEETDGLGSLTPLTSQETYTHSVFADTRKWVKEELVDYIIPQLYWSKDSEAAPYEELATWWNEVVKGTKVNLYMGHGTYKLYESLDEAWIIGNPIEEQMTFNESLDQVKGSAFFRFSYLIPEDSYFKGPRKESLEQHREDLKKAYGKIALIPENHNLIRALVAAPKCVSLIQNTLTFSDGNELFGQENLTKAFLIYQFPKEVIDPENSAFIFRKIVVIPGNKVYNLNSLDSEQYTYGISALNRLHQESEIILVNP